MGILIMWRFVFSVVLLCSIGLNFYLFMQLSVHTIENKLQSNNLQQNGLQQNSFNQKLASTVTKKNDDISISDNEAKLVDQIKTAIKKYDFYLARFLIITLADDNASALAKVRGFWLQTTQTLIDESLFNHVEDSINAYLDFKPNDADFLYLRVDSYLQQKFFIKAITSAYEIQYHGFSAAKQRSVILYARQLVQQQIDVFIQNNLWLELIDLIEQVSILDPDDPNLQWFFAQAQYQLGEFNYALNAVQPLLTLPNYQVKAQILLKKINLALREPESIKLSRHGEHFIVQGTINNAFNVSLMLDTGASISLLSEQAFDQLRQYADVEYLKELQLNTAGGRVTASIYQVSEFEIQGYVLKDFIFAVSPFISGNNDGLLGMNYLGAFDFHIDQTNDLLILTNK